MSGFQEMAAVAGEKGGRVGSRRPHSCRFCMDWESDLRTMPTRTVRVVLWRDSSLDKAETLRTRYDCFTDGPLRAALDLRIPLPIWFAGHVWPRLYYRVWRRLATR